MARGQYEQPYHRPQRIFGPPRPPIVSSRSSSQSSTSSSTTSPASPIASPLAERSQNVVVVISITKADKCEHHIANLKTTLESEPVVVEEVETVDDALRALARKPKAVIMNKDTLQDPSFEDLMSEMNRYVQDGGCLTTDASEALLASKNCPRQDVGSQHSWHRVEW